MIRNILHVIIGFIVWNYMATVTNLAWGEFGLDKVFPIIIISGIFGAVCGLCQEWLQEQISKGSFSDFDVKLTAIGFVSGGLLAYAFCVPSWLFCVAIAVVIIDWLRNIFKWKV
jgi:hypothetical protein